MFNILRVINLFFIALYGYHLFLVLVFNVTLSPSLVSFALAMLVVHNVIKFALSWSVEKEFNES